MFRSPSVTWLSCLVVTALFFTAPLSAQRGNRSVFVEVIDEDGAPVPGLTAEDFSVTENGQPRKVVRTASNVPMRVLLLVDTSSMVEPMINHIRAALSAFVDALPGTPEVGLITTGGPIRIRAQPMADRSKLTDVVRRLSSDGGANTLIETMIEADRRFLEPKPANHAWPVMVILTTDMAVNREEPDLNRYNAMVQSLMRRGANAHAVVMRGLNSAMISEIAQNLTWNLDGIFETINVSTAMGDYMKRIAARIAADHQAMTNRYEVEFQSGTSELDVPISVQVRPGLTVQMSLRRPF